MNAFNKEIFTNEMTLVEMLKSFVVLSQYKPDLNLGILTNRYDHAKLIGKELDALIHSIPEWFRQPLKRRQIVNFEFDTGSRISVFNNVDHLKGRSMIALGVYDSVNWNEYDIMQILPCIMHGDTQKLYNKIIRFTE